MVANLRKIMAWVAVALIVLYVIKSPDHAAEFLRTAGSGIAKAATSLASFVGSLL
jgi:hypothetical protein